MSPRTNPIDVIGEARIAMMTNRPATGEEQGDTIALEAFVK